MKSSSLALKKGRDLAGHNIFSTEALRKGVFPERKIYIRLFSGSGSLENKEKEFGKQHLKPARRAKNDKFKDRDFFLSVLNSTATKRDARAYLQQFTPPKTSSLTKKPHPFPDKQQNPEQQHGVNLGTLFGVTRAVDNSPKFTQQPGVDILNTALNGPLHIALVKIRAPQNMEDETLDGVALTLSQLAKLGLTSTIVIDCEHPKNEDTESGERWRTLVKEQADRVAEAIDVHGEPGARQIMNVIGFSENDNQMTSSAANLRGKTHIIYRKLLMTPLRRGIIPVIVPIGYTDKTHRAVSVKADDVILALTREFAGLEISSCPDESYDAIGERLKALRSEVSLDRLIILDPCGGIPNNQPNGYHVFLNLEQEFGPVKQELLSNNRHQTSSIQGMSSGFVNVSNIAQGNPFSHLVEEGFESPSSDKPKPSASLKAANSEENTIHLQNLELTRRVLSLLPPSSSALLTTPEEAANSGRQPGSTDQQIGVGTRRQRNPLIHNLLTDKPVFSSSLPPRRIARSLTAAIESVKPLARMHPTTFVKRGMAVTIFPNPKAQPWLPCLPGKAPLTLEDSRIDLSRLVYLIDDSFNRKLDVDAYLQRVNDRIAGVIIAGEYEGGALLTWELPPGVPDDGSEASRVRMVPYLDKFAVLNRAQGAGGVADILFKTMVRDCFPEGVCWRSRRDNPVNKWYFERSRGTWKLPNTNWTMFWTTPDLDLNGKRFGDYAGVCRSILPTWADGKAIMD